MTKEEALDILRDLHEKSLFSERTALETFVPELKYSKDELIRQSLLIYFSKTGTKWFAGAKREDIVDWLKKRGEIDIEKPITIGKKSLTGKAAELAKEVTPESLEEARKQLIAEEEVNSWKPSEGQLECLGYAIDKAEKDYSPLAGNRIYLTLKALKEQLEKLKNGY